jgi:hypothetical protein
MLIAADTHVHLYPFYDRDAALDGAFRRLAALAPDAGVRAVFLTERYDCDAFTDLPGERVQGYAVRWKCDGPGENVVFAGRQIVTRERLEVLALTIDKIIPDGLILDDVIGQVRALGGVPVVAWAPGKWFGARGEMVRRLVDVSAPGLFLLGDSSLRPTVWPEPDLMKAGRRRGFHVVAGSDPLPFRGEERMAGTYGTCLEGHWDAAAPVSSARTLLYAGVGLRLIGRRGGPATTALRLWKNRAAKKKAA